MTYENNQIKNAQMTGLSKVVSTQNSAIFLNTIFT